jgi:hypothetical protein
MTSDAQQPAATVSITSPHGYWGQYARPMRRAALTALIAAGALTGCGASTSPAADGGAGTSATPSATSARSGSSSSPGASGSRTERPPTCYPVIFAENSGNGPTYHVRICDALQKPQPGHEWQLIVDGGRLSRGAIIFGEQVPR